LVGLDSNAKEISKEVSESIKRWRFYSFVGLKQSDLYKAFKIEPTSDTSIQATIAEKLLVILQEETFLYFLKDLDDNLITNENLKGKIV
jgi:hypothetical protein